MTQNFPGSPVVKPLASTTGGTGSIPGRQSRIPNASRHRPKKKNFFFNEKDKIPDFRSSESGGR